MQDWNHLNEIFEKYTEMENGYSDDQISFLMNLVMNN